MKISEVMTRDVVFCQVNDTLEWAARAMWDHDVGVLPVLEGQEVVAMITDRDIAMAALLGGCPLNELRVGATMSRTLHSCGKDDSCVFAEEQMAENGVRRLPVLDDGLLVGLLSVDDLARASAVSSEVSALEVAWTLSAVSALRPLVGPT